MSRQMTNYGSMGHDSEVGFSSDNRNIDSLSESLSEKIFSINKVTKNLQQCVASLGTARDSQGLRDQIHVYQQSAVQIIKSSNEDADALIRLSQTCNRSQQLQAKKIIGHFQEAVKECSNIQMVVVDKLRKNVLRQQLMEDEQGMSAEDEQKQLVLAQNLQLDVDLMVEREMRINMIESEIEGINQMMVNLAEHVKEQAAGVDSIEANVETARAEVEQGHVQLTSASRLLNKMRKRKLYCLVFLILILGTLIGILIWAGR